ncbi:hypothetical protein DAMA08_004920 [Martiniozyma asiatica (nom. inval.)]|nr:hypothetical protein DAMA08_004920 [Martiniozyma asiatica]
MSIRHTTKAIVKNRLKKRKWEPIENISNVFQDSPIYKNPQLYSNKYRYLSPSLYNRTYKDPFTSLVANVLASPRRMAGGTRTIISRSLMFGTKAIGKDLLPVVSEYSQPDKKLIVRKFKNKPMKSVLVPYHPLDFKAPEDPIVYYPLGCTQNGKNQRTGNDKLTISSPEKGVITNSLWPESMSPIGWVDNNNEAVQYTLEDVILQYLMNKYTTSFSTLTTATAESLDVVIICNSDSNLNIGYPIKVHNKTTTIHLQTDKLLNNKLKIKLQTLKRIELEMTQSSKQLIISFFRLALHL